MPATPQKIEVPAQRHIAVAEGLTPEELDIQLDRFFKGIGEMRLLPKPRYLLEGWIPAGATVFLTGHGNSGKTLVALAWAECISRGWAWAGHDVLDPGTVLYITQEGSNAIPHRLEAYIKQRGGNPDDGHTGVWLYPKQLKLGAQASQYSGEPTYGEDWDKLAGWITEHKPKAVFLDPWADHFNIGQENSNDDVRAWTSKARGLLGLNGDDAPALVILAHTSHENIKGGSPRGASASYDGADRVYTISPVFPTEDGSAGYSTQGDLLAVKLSTLKSKDGGRPGPWYGELYEHDVEGALGDTSVALDGVDLDRFRELEALAKQSKRTVKTLNTKAQVRQRILETVKQHPGVLRSKITNSTDYVDGVAGAVKAELVAKLLDAGILEDRNGLYLVEQDEPDEL